MWRTWNQLLVEFWNSATSVENSMVVPLKIKKRTTIWSSNLTSRNISKKNWKQGLKELFIQPMFIAATIHSNQEVETTQMSFNRWMDKQNVVYTYNRILFTLKKQGNPVTSYNMNEPWVHIMLNEINQSQKDKYCMIPLIWGI